MQTGEVFAIMKQLREIYQNPILKEARQSFTWMKKVSMVANDGGMRLVDNLNG
jgi:hypothetical protein